MKVGSRSRYRRGALVFSNRPNSSEHLAVSIRKKWLGGFELAVHVLDVSAYSPVDSPLDSEASDRMGRLNLPDHARPLYPIPPDLLAFRPGEKRPSLTLTWKLDKNMVPGSFRIRSTTFRVECVIDPTEIEDILNGHSHTHSVAVLRLNQLVNLLAARRRNNGGSLFPLGGTIRVLESGGKLETVKSDSEASRVIRKIELFASSKIGKWCRSVEVPAIYVAQDPPEHMERLVAISNSVVRTHEMERQTPTSTLVSEPAAMTPFGTGSPCSFLNAVSRYPDLVV